jgi:hypothetical protein
MDVHDWDEISEEEQNQRIEELVQYLRDLGDPGPVEDAAGETPRSSRDRDGGR